MRIRGSAAPLTEAELDAVERAAKRILSETGFRLLHRPMLERLAQEGYRVDFSRNTVWFTENQLEDYLRAVPEPVDWDNLPPLKVQMGLYTFQWLDPDTDRVLPATLESTANLTRLMDWLPNGDTSPGLGTPRDVPEPLVPLWQYFIAWRYAERSDSRGGGIFRLDTLPYMKDMADVMISQRGGSYRDWLEIGVEFKSPLTFGEYEAQVFYETARAGMNPVLMSMPSIGGTGPVTLAGSLALGLAECWVTNLLHSLFTGRRYLRYLASVSPLDLRTGNWRFGRAETALCHMAFGQLAKRRRALYHANCFVCDAQRPSAEAGYEKAMSLIPAVLGGTVGTGSCGMLSVDEYNSPVQMILDDEYAGMVKRLARGFDITEDTLALPEIAREGFDGWHFMTDFTVERMREELYTPRLFTPHANSGWEAAGSKHDTDLAREIWHHVLDTYHPRGVDEDGEAALRGIIRRAQAHLC